MRGGAQAERARLVEYRRELIAVDGDDLQAVGAPRGDVADPRANLGRRAHAAFAHHRVDEDARRDDRVRVALALPPLRFLEIAADLAGGRHAGRQVQVALVLNRLRHAGLALLVPVHVGIDDARHHVLAGGVDDGVRARDRAAGRADRRDDAVLEDDVDGPVRRTCASVNHHRVANQQPPLRSRVKQTSAACAVNDGGTAETAQYGSHDHQRERTSNGHRCGSNGRPAIIHLIKWRVCRSSRSPT